MATAQEVQREAARVERLRRRVEKGHARRSRGLAGEFERDFRDQRAMLVAQGRERRRLARVAARLESARRPRWDACASHGHAYTPDNIVRDALGRRLCKACWDARSARMRKPREDVCGVGHKYSPDNIVRDVRGRRLCKACWRARSERMRGAGNWRSRPPRPCSVEGCDRGASARGWCHKHYMAWWSGLSTSPTAVGGA